MSEVGWHTPLTVWYSLPQEAADGKGSGREGAVKGVGHTLGLPSGETPGTAAEVTWVSADGAQDIQIESKLVWLHKEAQRINERVSGLRIHPGGLSNRKRPVLT